MYDIQTGQAAEASCASLKLPAQLLPFSEPSRLLPGENLRDFATIRQVMVDDIQPVTNIEWLWTLDLVELSWEILRYRNLKNRSPGYPSGSRDRSDSAATGRRGNAGRVYADGPTTSEADGRRMA